MPQYIYETLSTDVRCSCPTNKLAKDFAKSLKHEIYRYVLTYAPSKPIKYGKFFKYPPHNAFHMWDTDALFGFKLIEQFGYKPTLQNFVFMKSIRETFCHFMKYGNLEINNWKPGQSAIFGSDAKVHVLTGDYHGKQCKFWNDEKNGFVPYTWIN